MGQQLKVDPLKLRNEIRRMRREEERMALAIGAEVTKLVEHLFWDTQWTTEGEDGESRPLRAYIFRKNGSVSHRKVRRLSFDDSSYVGITEDGVATDLFVGLCTVGWSAVSVEDALLILADVKQWLKRKNKPKAPRAPKGEPAKPAVLEVTWS